MKLSSLRSIGGEPVLLPRHSGQPLLLLRVVALRNPSFRTFFDAGNAITAYYRWKATTPRAVLCYSPAGMIKYHAETFSP